MLHISFVHVLSESPKSLSQQLHKWIDPCLLIQELLLCLDLEDGENAAKSLGGLLAFEFNNVVRDALNVRQEQVFVSLEV